MVWYAQPFRAEAGAWAALSPAMGTIHVSPSPTSALAFLTVTDCAQAKDNNIIHISITKGSMQRSTDTWITIVHDEGTYGLSFAESGTCDAVYAAVASALDVQPVAPHHGQQAPDARHVPASNQGGGTITSPEERCKHVSSRPAAQEGFAALLQSGKGLLRSAKNRADPVAPGNDRNERTEVHVQADGLSSSPSPMQHAALLQDIQAKNTMLRKVKRNSPSQHERPTTCAARAASEPTRALPTRQQGTPAKKGEQHSQRSPSSSLPSGTSRTPLEGNQKFPKPVKSTSQPSDHSHSVNGEALPRAAAANMSAGSEPTAVVASAWSAITSPDGATYYHNSATGETTWNCPPELRNTAGTAASHGRNSRFWVPDEIDGYARAVSVEELSSGKARCSVERSDSVSETLVTTLSATEKSRIVPFDSVIAANAHLTEDLVLAGYLTEPTVLHCLRERYARDHIYTAVGTIIVSVNPFKPLPLYSPTKVDAYARRGVTNLPPHVYTVCDTALKDVALHRRSQAIMISGESGAGKTEATKQMLQFLADVAGSQNGCEARLLQASPVLEAFGNARTSRNNNSSRFGKWIEVSMDAAGSIASARIEAYLLEKSRVSLYGSGERNYHVFYQLLRGADDHLRGDLGLPTMEVATRLGLGGEFDAPGIDDAAEFAITRRSLTALGIDDNQQRAMWSIVAGVLALGNVNVEGESYTASIAMSSHVESAARLLGVPAPGLVQAVTQRTLLIPGQDATTATLTGIQSIAAIDAVIQNLYARLFDHLLARINVALDGTIGLRAEQASAASDSAKSSHDKSVFVGVLDIFGFEIFEINSFEQLCINLANEVLQQIFNAHTFKEEEALYEREGVAFERVDYADNQHVIDLVCKRPQGILPLCDEEIYVPKGTDESFVDKIRVIHASHPAFSHGAVSRGSQSGGHCAFVVRHYAGSVTYSAQNFLEKNKDELTYDAVELLQSSTNTLVAEIFREAAGSDGAARLSGPRKSRKPTLSAQFSRQLLSLRDKLSRCEQHYVRTIKPNDTKQPGMFNGARVLEQLRCSGVFDAIEIRRRGYPCRLSWAQFVHRYQVFDRRLTKGSHKDRALALLQCVQRSSSGSGREALSEIVIGKTMLLYRTPAHMELELQRARALSLVVVVIQAQIRGWRARRLYRRIRKLTPNLERAIQQRDIQKLDQYLSEAENVWFETRPLRQARAWRFVLSAEKECKGYLQHPEEHYEDLQRFVEQSEIVSFSSSVVNECKAAVKLVAEIRTCRKELQESVEAADRHRLEEALATAEALGLQNDKEYIKAREFYDIQLRELEAVRMIASALERGGITSGPFDASRISIETLESAIAHRGNADYITEEARSAHSLAITVRDLRRALLADDWKAVEVTVLAAGRASQVHGELEWASGELSRRYQEEQVQARIDWAIGNVSHPECIGQLSLALSAAKTMGYEDELVKRARALHTDLLEILKNLHACLHKPERALLEHVVQRAASIGYETDDVEKIRCTLAHYDDVEQLSRSALETLETDELEAAARLARQFNLWVPSAREVLRTLQLPPHKLIQKQLAAATRAKNREKIIKYTVAFKTYFLSRHKGLFELHNFHRLRLASAQGDAKKMQKYHGKIAALLQHQSTALAAPLTDLNGAERSTALQCFRLIQGFSGSRQYHFPAAIAAELATIAIENEAVRDEIFIQLLKQMRGNVSSSTRAVVAELMMLMLTYVPPSSDFENFLETELRRQGLKDCVLQLHTILHDGAATEAPLAEEIAFQLQRRTFRVSRYSLVA